MESPHTTSQYKVLLYLLPFGRNANVELWLPIRLSIWFGGRVRVDLDRVEKCIDQNIKPTILFDLYTQTYLAPFGHNTQGGRRQRASYSVGGLTIHLQL